QRDVVGLTRRRMRGRGGVDDAETRADAPLQFRAAGVGTGDARVEDGPPGLRTVLVGELTPLKVLDIPPQRRDRVHAHRPPRPALSGALIALRIFSYAYMAH